MIARKTARNQITLPKEIIEELPDAEYFDIHIKNGTIVLRPVGPNRADWVREKLASCDISGMDVQRAVKFAREKGRGKNRLE